MCNIDLVAGVARQYRVTAQTDIPPAFVRKMGSRKKAYKILIEEGNCYIPFFRELPVMEIGTTYEMSDPVHGFYAYENLEDAEKIFERECDFTQDDEQLVLAEVMLYNVLVEGFNLKAIPEFKDHAVKALMAKKQKIVKILKRRYE